MSEDKDNVFDFFAEQAGLKEPKSKTQAMSEAEQRRSTAGGQSDGDPYTLPPLRPQEYTAFRLGKRRERLLIDRAAAPMRFPAYHQLEDISFDQTLQQVFSLFFHEMTVEIMGENLWPVAHAIASGRCEAIYEYHAKLYPAPPAKGEPVIRSIKIVPPVVPADN
jgi:hypothetical protein